MRRNKLSTIVISICLILALISLMPACAGPTATPTPTPTPTPKEPIKIGALLPITGPFAMWGSWFERSHKFALDEANWEVAGRPIELIIEDEGGYDVSVMTEKLRKLVEADKVDVMTGPFFGSMRPAALPYLAEHRIVAVDNHCAERPELQYDYSFDGSQCYIDMNYYQGKYAYEAMGIRTVSTMGWDYSCPRDFIEGFVDGFTEAGGTVVQQQWTEMGATDYTPYLTALKPADALVTALCGGDTSVRALTQADELGIREKMKGWFVLGTAELESSELRDQLGDKGIGVVYAGPWSPLLDTPINKEFVEKFKAKFGIEPSCWDAVKYEATKVMLAALEATGGDTSGDKLKKALLELKIELPSGPFSFDQGRMGVRNNYIMQIQKVNGQYIGVIIKTITGTHSRAQEYPYP